MRRSRSMTREMKQTQITKGGRVTVYLDADGIIVECEVKGAPPGRARLTFKDLLGIALVGLEAGILKGEIDITGEHSCL
jgi:hypothetical protein